MHNVTVVEIEEEEEADADLPQAPSSDKIHKGDHEEQEGVTGSSFHPLDLEYGKDYLRCLLA